MNPKKRKMNRLLALLLSCSMLVPITGNLVYAAPAENGLCEHHTEHTAECGYVEGAEASPCTFVCELCSSEPAAIEIGDDPITISAEDCKDGCQGHLLTGSTELTPSSYNDFVISISGGSHTLIMDDFSFTQGSSNGYFSEFLQIDGNAEVTLKVQNENKIDFGTNGNRGTSNGITVYEGSNLTIAGENRESAKLEILTYDGIGIGADDYDFDLGYRGMGNITVQDCALDVSVTYDYSYENAIGGRFYVRDGEVSGKIKIVNSDVTTKGSIGQGYNQGASDAEGDGWDISIESSNVTVTQASRYCAAIGGGGCSNSYSGVNKGAISIVNSTVNADASAYSGWYGAAIGGAKGQGSGTITIKGSQVTAKGASSASGIGGGWSEATTSSGVNRQALPPTCGDITIEDSTIESTGGANAAAIGGGSAGDAGNIFIRNSNVTAAGGSGAAAIGGGIAAAAKHSWEQGQYGGVANLPYHETWGGQAGEIVIEGSVVNATTDGGAGIGAGALASNFVEDEGHEATQIIPMTITIRNSQVTASSNQGAGIGYGKNWKKASLTNEQDSITVESGTVIASSTGENTAGYGLDAGDKGTIVVSGGSVKARGKELTSGTAQSTSVAVTNGSENGNKNSPVSERIIVLEDKKGQKIAQGDSIESGMTWVDQEMAVTLTYQGDGYHYGMSDVNIDENGNFYVYLPKGEEIEQYWYYEVYYEYIDPDTNKSEWVLHDDGQGGKATPDTTVSISHTSFDGDELGWEDITGEQNEKLGTHYVYDKDYGPHRLSALCKEATEANPLKIYYRAALNDVVYKYEGTVPEGADELLPETEKKPYYSSVMVASAPELTGYEFSGWTVESPDYTEVENGAFIMPNEKVTLVGSWTESEEPGSITLTPQDMIAYTGGDSLSGDTFPTPRYKVEAADGVELSKVSFSVDGDTETLPEGTEPGDIVVLPWLDETFTLQESAAMALSAAQNDAVAGEYEIDVDTTGVTASDETGNPVELAINPGTLTVRNVSAPQEIIAGTVDIAQPVVSDPAQVNTDDGIGMAVIPENTSFYTNGKAELGLLGKTSSGSAQIALLFDDLLPGEQSEDTKQLLIDRAAAAGYTLTDENTQFKYLDLINENDGNAWVSTADGTTITIYWPLPEGVTASDVSVEVLHFKGLHREYRGDLANQVTNCEVEAISASIEGGNVVFELEGNQTAGSFSPFAIHWTKKSDSATSQTGNSTTPQTGGSTTPQTGDPTDSSIWIVLMAVSCIGLVGILVLMKKKRYHSEHMK